MRDLRTTSLIDIRNFLRVHDAAPPPWKSAEAVIEHLFALLRGHTGDDAFWRDLKTLCARLEDKRFDRNAFACASALDAADLDAVIDRLRAELGLLNGSSNGVRAIFTRPLGGVAVLGFLLLATSYSCFSGEGDDDNDDVAITSEDCDQAEFRGFEGHEAAVYCTLIDLVRDSSLMNWEQNEILSCIAGLNSAERESLLEKFQDMSDEALAEYLRGMQEAGGECWEDDAWDDDH
ncbi:hypothetical protein K8I61_03510 [bacterium]|nr:hypothetical protein [bacterium]